MSRRLGEILLVFFFFFYDFVVVVVVQYSRLLLVCEFGGGAPTMSFGHGRDTLLLLWSADGAARQLGGLEELGLWSVLLLTPAFQFQKIEQKIDGVFVKNTSKYCK